MPKFTIFTCTYQNANFISRCYNSILKQSVHDWEWLIIDDGSTDLTEKIINSISDNRIQYYRLQTNLGRGRARNYGCKLIKSPWVVILDMDDLMTQDRLNYAEMASILGYDYMISGVGLITNDLICDSIRPAIYTNFINVFTHATLCCKSGLYKSIGYFDSRYSEDQLMIVTLSLEYKGYVVNEPLYLYLESANQNIDGAIIANIHAFSNLFKLVFKYKKIKFYIYIFSFLIKSIFLKISKFFNYDYQYFIKNRVKSSINIPKIDYLNFYLKSFKKVVRYDRF